MAKEAKSGTRDAAAGTAAGAKVAAAKAATPWGPATVIEEVKVAQRAGDKRFSSLVQLLENDRGESLIRFSYTTDGVVRRGPVTLRPKDLERLRATLDSSSALAVALGWSGEPGASGGEA